MKRLLLLGFLLCAALPARAQFHVGAHAGYDFEVEDAYVGVTTHFALPNTAFVLAPSVDYFLGSDLDFGSVTIDRTLLALNVDVIYLFGIDNQTFTPYAGVGGGLLYQSISEDVAGLDLDDTDTDLGAHITGGAIFGDGSLRPFAAARVRLLGEPLTSLQGGVMFTF